MKPITLHLAVLAVTLGGGIAASYGNMIASLHNPRKPPSLAT
jgi:hypothetical protein